MNINSIPYFSDKDVEKNILNIEFRGSYKLLKYIVQKYNLSQGEITRFAVDNNYSIPACQIWNRNNKVPPRLWSVVHKDLIMLRLLGKIEENDVMTLEELREEFNFLSHN
jgi:hypothetical protein